MFTVAPGKNVKRAQRFGEVGFGVCSPLEHANKNSAHPGERAWCREGIIEMHGYVLRPHFSFQGCAAKPTEA